MATHCTDFNIMISKLQRKIFIKSDKGKVDKVMIIQTGMRTDIPAFYHKWLINRIEEGYVFVRNPYNPKSVTRYSLSSEVVDLIVFCTKNPKPMLSHMDVLKPYGQYWFVTITPYGSDIEPNVPDKETVMESFKKLSQIVGKDSVGWRYDPVFINKDYSVRRHISEFEKMAETLSGYTETCVISFIDIYKKVKCNFPGIEEVSEENRIKLGKEFIKIASKYGMTIKPCAEGNELEAYGADCSGCMTVNTFEKAINNRLNVPKRKNNQRNGKCACILGTDIGAYDTCGHLCKYCYANTNNVLVKENMRKHNEKSPFLIGDSMPDDIIHDAVQESWIDWQMQLDFKNYGNRLI